MKKQENREEEEEDVISSYPEIKGLGLLALSSLMLLSLLSFSHTGSSSNLLGLAGHGLAWGLIYLLGINAYLLTAILGWIGWRYLASRDNFQWKERSLHLFMLLVSTGLLWNLLAEHMAELPTWLTGRIYSESVLLEIPYLHHAHRHNLGGVPLYFVYHDLPGCNLKALFSDLGVLLIFSVISLISWLLLTRTEMGNILELGTWVGTKLQALLQGKELASALTHSSHEEIERSLTPRSSVPTPPKEMRALPRVESRVEKASAEEQLSAPTQYRPLWRLGGLLGKPESRQESPAAPKNTTEALPSAPAAEALPEPHITTNTGTEEKRSRLSLRGVIAGAMSSLSSAYQLPSPSLLTSPKRVDTPSLKKDLRKQAEILEETLLSFGIEAKVGEIHCGPTITAFEVHPAVGVKVQKIKALENDIALNLQAKSIRIIAPIPGKAAVGIEIPSPYPQEVSFKEMLTTYQQGKRFFIPVLLGKTVTGESVMADLAKMPHCIIAGATGSGKSVCINTLIMSILMTAKPDEIKLLMIDPKKVELTPYTALPHMITPVITEPHGAYAALNWLVKEMQHRYEILKQLGLRNITAFNSRKIDKQLEESLGLLISEKMFAVVAIIDEFADLMMVSSSDLETPIARIAQMARAVGIHLVLATQRPSREVITGLIKANFPTRIAFKVASRINSQIILDEVGAESLLGNGDMLFLPPGSSQLVRAQGAYIRDEDIQRVVAHCCEQQPTNYLIESFDRMPTSAADDDEDGPRDTLYQQALQVVVETQTASTTFLQRKLKIGYARAASLIDELEQKGVIGPQEGGKPRRILVKSGVRPEGARNNWGDHEEGI